MLLLLVVDMLRQRHGFSIMQLQPALQSIMVISAHYLLVLPINVLLLFTVSALQ